ncbi:MAG TPA: hypothetical protein VGI51_09665 [Steroidobacteraceae bacterium]|jgi:hypothetical protein
MRALLALMLIFAALDGNAKTVLLTHMPLQWKPTSELASGTTDMDATPIQFEAFQDVRNDKEKVGENLEDAQPKPVTTSDDVGAFVSSHMRGLFDRAGLKVVDSDAAVTIKGEVRQFFAKETSTYNSQVEVQLTLVDRDGNTIWKGIASGEATRFGRSYKIENYYEVLSDAVVNTVSSLLRSAEFRKALARR